MSVDNIEGYNKLRKTVTVTTQNISYRVYIVETITSELKSFIEKFAQFMNGVDVGNSKGETFKKSIRSLLTRLEFIFSEEDGNLKNYFNNLDSVGDKYNELCEIRRLCILKLLRRDK